MGAFVEHDGKSCVSHTFDDASDGGTVPDSPKMESIEIKVNVAATDPKMKDGHSNHALLAGMVNDTGVLLKVH